MRASAGPPGSGRRRRRRGQRDALLAVGREDALLGEEDEQDAAGHRRSGGRRRARVVAARRRRRRRRRRRSGRPGAAPPASTERRDTPGAVIAGRTYPRPVSEPPRLQFEVDGRQVEVADDGALAARGAARPARRPLGQGRLQPPGPVRVLHGAGRRRAPGGVRDAGPPGGRPVDHHPRRPAARRPAALGRRLLRHRRQPVRLLHARDHRAAGGRCGAKGVDLTTRPRSTGPSPPTCAGAPGWRTILDAWPDSLRRSRCAGRGPRRRRPPGDARGRRPAAGRARRRPRRGRVRRRHRARRRPRGRARRRTAAGRSARRSPRPGAAAGKVQGRRTTVEPEPPARRCPTGDWDLTLRTTWVEPAYLETDASWCEPGGEPATPLANGGAFGGKVDSPVAAAARRLADEHGRAVRVLLAREDTVRLGPEAAADRRRRQPGRHRCRPGRPHAGHRRAPRSPPGSRSRRSTWPARRRRPRCGPRAGPRPRSSLAGARGEVGWSRHPGGGRATAAGGRRHGPRAGRRAAIPLDEVVLRSYCIGAAHMALGWVCSEGLAVDDDGRGPRPHHPLVRHPPGARHAPGRRRDRAVATASRSTGPTPCSPRWPPRPGSTRAARRSGPRGTATVEPMTKPVGAYTPIVRAGDWLVVVRPGRHRRRPARHRRLRRPAQAGDRQPRGPARRRGRRALANVVKTTVFLRHMGDYDLLNEDLDGPLRRPPARPGPPSPSPSCRSTPWSRSRPGPTPAPSH